MRYLVLTLLLTFLLSGCGILFTQVDHPIAATSQPKGDKVGQSCAHTVLFLLSFGDASTERARKNGRIQKIVTVDGSFTNILGLYQEYCTTVRGW